MSQHILRVYKNWKSRGGPPSTDSFSNHTIISVSNAVRYFVELSLAWRIFEFPWKAGSLMIRKMGSGARESGCLFLLHHCLALNWLCNQPCSPQPPLCFTCFIYEVGCAAVLLKGWIGRFDELLYIKHLQHGLVHISHEYVLDYYCLAERKRVWVGGK